MNLKWFQIINFEDIKISKNRYVEKQKGFKNILFNLELINYFNWYIMNLMKMSIYILKPSAINTITYQINKYVLL